MTKLKLVAAVSVLVALAGCNVIASKTNVLTDDQIKSQAGGALGYSPEELTLVSRRTEGTNTFAALKSKDNQQFNCIINGGNLLTFGMTNPPSCAKKGQSPVSATPFGG
jgi:outer membrane protein assembly factor BamE (lipoprotein component of BamABCDE complex)